MQKEKFIDFLKTASVPYSLSVPMAEHTTFKIGGNAEIFITPETAEDFAAVYKKAKEFSVPVFVLGNGSNLLVSDNGIDGAVISTLALSSVSLQKETIICGAGASLRSICLFARDNSLKGLEFAYGIPGSVGGAFYMNAGAYGGEIKDVALSAVCLNSDGKLVTTEAPYMNFGYRKSIFKDESLIILSVKLKLQKGNKAEITEQMNGIFAKRVEKQPLDYPSAGSTFKRPEGYYAGALIEQNGFKGFSVGGAMVSEKHAGFVINYDKATAKDVKNLIKKIQDKVKENDGVLLEPEVIFVGK